MLSVWLRKCSRTIHESGTGSRSWGGIFGGLVLLVVSAPCAHANELDETASDAFEPEGLPPSVVGEPAPASEDVPGEGGEDLDRSNESGCVDDGSHYDADWYCSGDRRVERTSVWQTASLGFVFGLPTSDEQNSKSTWSLGVQGQATWGNSWAQLGGFLGWSGGGLDTGAALRHGQLRTGPRGRLILPLGPVSFYGSATLGLGMDYSLEPDDDSRVRDAYFYALGGPGMGLTIPVGRGDRSYKSWILDVGAHHYKVHWLTPSARDLPLATDWLEIGVMFGGTLEGLLEPSR